MCGFLRPPPQTIHSFGCVGQMLDRLQDRLGRHRGQRAGAVGELQPLGFGQGEVVAIERFRSALFEERIAEIALDDRADHAAFAGDGAVGVERHAAFARHPLVDQGIAGPGVEGQRVAVSPT